MRMAKIASNKSFLQHKRMSAERELAKSEGREINNPVDDLDGFEMQHHHLLTCLENTTVSTPIAACFLITMNKCRCTYIYRRTIF